MNEPEIRQALEGAVSSTAADESLDNYLLRGASLEDATITQVTFDAEVAEGVTGDVKQLASRFLSREFIPYDPAYQPGPHQVLTDAVSNSNILERIVAAVGADDAQGDFITDAPVVGMFHSLRIDGVTLTAVRLKGSGIATRRPRGKVALVDVDGIFQRISEEVVYYEPTFQALIVNDTILTTTPSLIQQQLGSATRAIAHAQATFDDVVAVLPIQGIDALREAATSEPAMIAKLASIARALHAQPDLAQHLTMVHLAQFVADRPDIPVDILDFNGQPSFVFDNRPQRRWNILKLIADDFLESGLSGLRYESGSKQAL